MPATAEKSSLSLQNIVLALFCLVPLLLATTRAGADMVICLIGVLFLLHCARAREWQWTKQPELRIFAVLWCYMMASSVFSTDAVSSFKTALVWGRLVLFYAAASYWLLQSPRNLNIVCRSALAILLLLLIDTGWQYATGVSLSGRAIVNARLSGPMSNPNIGNLMFKTALPMLGLLMYGAMAQPKHWKMWLINIFALSIMALVLVSGERSSSLLMLLGTFVCGTMCFIFRPSARKSVLLGALAVILLVTIVTRTQPVVQQRGHLMAQQVTDFWHTPYGQLYIGAYGLWKKNPMIGIGAGQFTRVCPPAMTELNINYCDVHPHNMYLEWLVDGGVIGFVLFVSAMLLLVRRVLRKELLFGDGWLPTAFACGTLAALLFPVIVTQSQFSNWPGMLFWYGLSLAVSIPRIASRPS